MPEQMNLFLTDKKDDKDTLENKIINLDNLNKTIIKEVKTALSVPHTNPRKHQQPYLKYDLVEAICTHVGIIHKKNFNENLYSEINKEPLKRVWYGIESTGKIPEEFLNHLSDWQKIYFFAGRWAIRNPDLDEPISILTIRHIKKGLDLLYEHHYVRKARGEYKRRLRIPEDAEIRKTYHRLLKLLKDNFLN